MKIKFINIKSLSSIAIWIICLAGYPFDFTYAFGYPFMAPLLLGLCIIVIMMSTRKLRSYRTFNAMYIILACFWIAQMILRVDVNYISNIFQVLCVVIIYLAIINFIGTENMSRQFVYFMIANCIGGTIITILLLVYNIPPGFHFLQHDGRTGFFYYLTFTNTVFMSDGFTVIRYSGLFDEPGALSFGCMFALILNKLTLKNRKSELLLLILPLFTFSLAHFVTSVLYVLLFYWKKTKLISSCLISLFGLYILINSTKDTEYSRIYNLTLARLEINDEGELSGNSRRDETESCLEYFKQSPVMGWGKSYFAEGVGKGHGVNGTNIYYNGALYGVLGFIFPYIIIYYIIFTSLLKFKMSSAAHDGLKCSLLIIINLFQRSYVTSIFPLFALTIIALCIHEILNKKSTNQPTCRLQQKNIQCLRL